MNLNLPVFILALAISSVSLATPLNYQPSKYLQKAESLNLVSTQKNAPKDEPININSADAQAISNSLEGIGKKRAEDIVNYRASHGPFKSIDDLEKVKGIGKSTLENNQENIIFETESN